MTLILITKPAPEAARVPMVTGVRDLRNIARTISDVLMYL